jgi:hypothetical protein
MIAMPLDSAVRLKLTQKKWLGDGHGFVSLLRALRPACVPTVCPA